MNPKKLVWPLLALILIVRSAPASEKVSSPPLRIITEEWPPFNFSENGEIKGFSTEVVQLIMKELNLHDHIEILPGGRGMQILDKGPRVMFYSFILTPERKPLYKWIGPFGGQSLYFFKRKGSPLKIATLDDAKKVGRVCCRDKGLVYNSLKMAGFTNLDVAANPEGIYLKTIRGRCDLAIGETSWGIAYWLKKSDFPPDSLEKTPVKVLSSPLYIVVSKDVPDQEVLLWQQALEKVKSSSEYSKLQQTYIDSSK
jgi:polar amino acid transport system substrate-binding protein